MLSTNGVIRTKCSKVQQLDPATPQRSLPTMLCRILRLSFPQLEPDCYPTLTSPQIEMVLLTGNVGTLCFQSRAPASADWPSKGLFLLCVEFCWIGSRERCRKCNMVKESMSQGEESSLFAQQFVMSVYHYECVVVYMLCVYVFLWVCMCTLHCNQMRVGFYSMCGAVFRQKELSVCLFVQALCVFVSPFLGNRLSLAKQAASNSTVTSVTPTHHHHHHHHLHPSSPSRREAGNRFSAI